MANEVNTIGKEFSLKDLIKFTAAPVISKLFISLLSTLDDSLFISRYCGQNALAAFTIALPWFMLMDAVVMLICAVSTKCSILMGEKKNDQAHSCFTTIVLISLGIGCIFTTILSIFKIDILRFLGATDILLPYISEYMSISRFYIPLLYTTNLFARFYVVAGKPKVAVASTIIQTFCNFFFDWLFVVKMQIGIIGPAYANLISNIILTIIGIVFFTNKNHEIHFAKPVNEPFKLFGEVAKLGRSQCLTSIAVSLNTFICNQVLLNTGGESFVASFTIVNNIQFMFMQAFFGFLGSTSPIVSFAYGEKNSKKLANTMKRCTLLIQSLAILVGLFIMICKKPILSLYFTDLTDPFVVEMASFGMNVVPYCYNIFSFNILVQEYSVAVSNYKASTFLSIMENVVFANLTVILMPIIFGKEAVWFTFLVSELFTLVPSLYVVYTNKDVYGYGKDEIATFTD